MNEAFDARRKAIPFFVGDAVTDAATLLTGDRADAAFDVGIAALVATLEATERARSSERSGADRIGSERTRLRAICGLIPSSESGLRRKFHVLRSRASSSFIGRHFERP